TAVSFLPRRMIEPLPKARSIWLSAASSAFDLSMLMPSTMRREIADIPALLISPGESPHKSVPLIAIVHVLFSLARAVAEGWRFSFPEPAGHASRPRPDR